MSGLDQTISDAVRWWVAGPAMATLIIGSVVPVLWGIVAFWKVKSVKTAQRVLAFWFAIDAFNVIPVVWWDYYRLGNGYNRWEELILLVVGYSPGLLLWLGLFYRLRRRSRGMAAAALTAPSARTASASPNIRASAATLAGAAKPASPTPTAARPSGGMTDREATLAARVAELEALTASRAAAPQGGNLVDQLWRYLTYFVPKPILAAGLAVFLVFHVWEFYNSGQKAQAETNLKQAEASVRDAEAVSNALTVNGRPMRAETYLTDLKKKQAEAIKAQRSAEAANAKAGNGLNTLEDELATNKAILAELDALNQELDAAITRAGTTGGYPAVARESVRVLCSSGYRKYFGCTN